MPDDLNTLLPAIYGAALQAEGWSLLMGRIGQGIGAHSSLLFQTPLVPGPYQVSAASNAAPGLLEQFKTARQPEDPFALAAARKGYMQAGTVVLGDELLSRNELHRSRFFNEFAAPFGIEAMLATVLLDGSEEEGLPFTNLCWYREPGSMGFDSGHKQFVQLLIPHLRNAMRIQHRLLSLQQAPVIASRSFESQGLASFVLDRTGRIHEVNAAAETLLATGGSGLLHVTKGKLHGLGDDCVPALTDALRLCRVGPPTKMLVRAPRPTASVTLDSMGQGRVANATSHLTHASLIALPPDARTLVGAFNGERLLLLLKLPQDDTEPLVARAAEMFGFTAREQEVVCGLLEGMTVEEIAHGNGTTVNTVRTQVKSLLAKGGFARQIDLVRTLGRLCH